MDTSLSLNPTMNSSLREFAKRERANSWQSTEIFCGVLGGGWLNFLGFLRLCLNFCDKVCLNLWIATLALWLARNDGQRKRTLSFYNDGALLSF